MAELSKDALILRSVYLFYREKMNIQTIAQRLGISRFRVSRYLKEAEDSGIVTVQINDSNLYYESLALELETKYKIKRIIIVPVSESMDSNGIRKMIAGKGGELLKDVTPDTSIGITWGRTIAYMVESLPNNNIKARQISELTGGLGIINADLPTSALASLFAKRFMAYCYQLSAPIIVSNAAIARTLLSDDSIRKTLEISRMSDIAICGIATLTADSMLYDAGLVNDRDLIGLREQGAVGSIIGRFYDSQGREVNSEFKERAIAIDFQDYFIYIFYIIVL